jgi:lysozyme
MLSRSFTKAAAAILVAVSLFTGTVTAGAYVPPPEDKAAAPLKNDWSAAIRNIKFAYTRRRQQTSLRQPQEIRESVWEKFIDHLLLREGSRNTVYRDSLGKPTVGVGHLVKPSDNLEVGDTISNARVREFLEQDAGHALEAAIGQAGELGIDDNDFIIALGSVNFQLGAGWRGKFPQTWRHLQNGNYEQAIRNLEGSAWARQTPVRVRDFVKAIRKIMAQEQQANAVVNPSIFTQSGDIAYQYA